MFARRFATTARRMTKIEWNVIVYDKPGTDRTQFRPQHVAAIPATVDAGIVTSAGAIYKDASKKEFAGSAFHLFAENREEIIDFLKQDVYAKEGIWDLDSVVANPLGLAVRVAKEFPKA